MKTTIDKYGRIVIPRVFRERLRLKPGTPIEIIEENDTLIAKAIPKEGNLEMENGVLVFSCVGYGALDKVIDEFRESRLESIISDGPQR